MPLLAVALLVLNGSARWHDLKNRPLTSLALAATVLVFPVQYVVDRLDLPRWSGTFLAALIIAVARWTDKHLGPDDKPRWQSHPMGDTHAKR